MTAEAGVLLPFALGALLVWWRSGDLAFLSGSWEQDSPARQVLGLLSLPFRFCFSQSRRQAYH